MKADRWEIAKDVFAKALALSPAERRALLDEFCEGEQWVREEVESLLAHDAIAPVKFMEPHRRASSSSEIDPADWAALRVGKRIGQYAIEDVVAVGGMGCVFKALQERPARAVALKVLLPGFAMESRVARFRIESEMLGRLQHAHIAQVFEAGICEHVTGMIAYFAMELIPGALSLTDYADARHLNSKQRLELFVKICDAVEHGHQKGVVHRDLKPANILVGSDGEPKVIDFGVARITDVDMTLTTQLTRVGDLVGTLRYMSPEQCDGDPSLIDTRSDIYSLGVVLYELLTGKAPYREWPTSPYSAIRVIKDESARQPSEIEARLRGDIDAILLKALEKDPVRRFQSASGLGQDIRRHLAGEPIEARTPTRLQRVAKWMARRPLLATSVACAIVVVATGLLTCAGYYVAVHTPWRMRIAPHSEAASLETVIGIPLHTWYTGGPGAIQFAQLVSRPATLGGGQLVIIGYDADMVDYPYGCFAFYDLRTDLENPSKRLALSDNDIPAVLRERDRRSTLSFREHDFGAAAAILADVFDDPAGTHSPELIAAHRHSAVTASSISIYRLDGGLLYRVWIDADIVALAFLPESGLVICAGSDGTALLKDRDLGGLETCGASHPLVVFALQPVLGLDTTEFVEQEPDARTTSRPELYPVWNFMVFPPSLYHRMELNKDALSPVGPGYDVKEAVMFRLAIHADLDPAPTQPPSRAWIIDGKGGIRDCPGGNVWELNGSTDEDPDRALPPFGAFYLDRLPPVAHAAGDK